MPPLDGTTRRRMMSQARLTRRPGAVTGTRPCRSAPMSETGKRLLAANEMRAIARGEAEPARTRSAPSSYPLAQALYDAAPSSRPPKPGVQLRLIAARTASGRDTIRLVSKRRTPSVEPPEKRPPMSPAQIASAAYSLAILQAHDDAAGDVAARDAAVYEMLTFALLGKPRDALPVAIRQGFDYLLNGLGVYARARSVECMHAASAGQRPSPLAQVVTPLNVH